jgi:TetR/AcrR family transcriptional regulator
LASHRRPILRYFTGRLKTFENFKLRRAMRPSKKPAKKTNNRSAEIMKAAEDLLGELGYDRVSVRDIARRAGVNKALVFYYYGSKEALFDQVLTRYYQAHYDALQDAFEGVGSFRERFQRMLDSYLDFIVSNKRYARLIQRLVAGGGERTEQIQRQLGPLFQWVENVLKDVTPSTGPLAARHFFISFSGMVINYFTYGPVLQSYWGGDPLSDEAVAERREHLHWIVGTLLDALERSQERAEE